MSLPNAQKRIAFGRWTKCQPSIDPNTTTTCDSCAYTILMIRFPRNIGLWMVIQKMDAESTIYAAVTIILGNENHTYSPHEEFMIQSIPIWWTRLWMWPRMFMSHACCREPCPSHAEFQLDGKKQRRSGIGRERECAIRTNQLQPVPGQGGMTGDMSKSTRLSSSSEVSIVQIVTYPTDSWGQVYAGGHRKTVVTVWAPPGSRLHGPRPYHSATRS